MIYKNATVRITTSPHNFAKLACFLTKDKYTATLRDGEMIYINLLFLKGASERAQEAEKVNSLVAESKICAQTKLIDTNVVFVVDDEEFSDFVPAFDAFAKVVKKNPFTDHLIYEKCIDTEKNTFFKIQSISRYKPSFIPEGTESE